jgi:hypothetical protein
MCIRKNLIATTGSYLAVLSMIVLCGSSALADEPPNADSAARCSAYFFMAANVNSIQEFDSYYSAGEYAYNDAVKIVGEQTALTKFNDASGEINELIDRDWLKFDKAETRYGVICADLLRDANSFVPVAPGP